MNLCCFGFGYTASYIVSLITSKYKNCNIIATKREIFSDFKGVKLIEFDKLQNLPENTTHILITIPPINGKDIVFEKYASQLSSMPNIKWIGYLSATNVYGDHQGKWIDETADLMPSNDRAKARLNAENKWLELFNNYNVPVVIFRLAGIYGKNRNQIERLQSGEVLPVIEAKGKYFSRIHVEDIAEMILKSIEKPTPGEIFNLADDLPSESADVIKHAYNLLNIESPKATKLKFANLSQMAKEFYMDNKRISNNKIKKVLGVKLKYPSYIEGLNSFL
ncbi:MAG: SDR family oxidoreductase [Alphaproteobacteria bacterium]